MIKGEIHISCEKTNCERRRKVVKVDLEKKWEHFYTAPVILCAYCLSSCVVAVKDKKGKAI